MFKIFNDKYISDKHFAFSMTNNDELKSKVFGWLVEEGFSVQSLSAVKDNFAFSVVLPNKKTLIVSQPLISLDKVLISSGYDLPQAQQNSLSSLAAESRERIFQEILFELFGLRVDCGPLNLPLSPRVSKAVYLDGLNKNLFMSAFFDVHNALWIVGLTLANRLNVSSPDISLSHLYG